MELHFGHKRTRRKPPKAPLESTLSAQRHRSFFFACQLLCQEGGLLAWNLILTADMTYRMTSMTKLCYFSKFYMTKLCYFSKLNPSFFGKVSSAYRTWTPRAVRVSIQLSYTRSISTDRGISAFVACWADINDCFCLCIFSFDSKLVAYASVLANNCALMHHPPRSRNLKIYGAFRLLLCVFCSFLLFSAHVIKWAFKINVLRTFVNYWWGRGKPEKLRRQ